MRKHSSTHRPDHEKAANIIHAAGGRVIGRTRLQKIAYLLEAAGLGEGFSFSYHHYGPYSEELNLALQLGDLFGTLKEEERIASWGGKYSVFTADKHGHERAAPARRMLAKIAADADPVELELAATAVFLSAEGVGNAWQEAARRKPDKAANGQLERAKELYARLQKLETPKRLPLLH